MLSKFKTLRKCLVYPALSARIFSIIGALLHNKSGAYLQHILTHELPNFYQELVRLRSDDLTPICLQMPQTTKVHDAMVKIQKLSSKQLYYLRSTLPKHDLLTTSSKRDDMALIYWAKLNYPMQGRLKNSLKTMGFQIINLKPCTHGFNSEEY